MCMCALVSHCQFVINRGQNSRLTGMRVCCRMVINLEWSDTCVTAERRRWSASRRHESVKVRRYPLVLLWLIGTNLCESISRWSIQIPLLSWTCGARSRHGFISKALKTALGAVMRMQNVISTHKSEQFSQNNDLYSNPVFRCHQMGIESSGFSKELTCICKTASV